MTRIGPVRVRHLAATTTALTFALILLGVYTAASGAGLACSGQWPTCDSGLFPTTLPSFIEWFHRLVAMITGFFILGTTAAVWRTYPRKRVRYAAALATLVLPAQVVLGGATVLRYTALVQTAHHAAAMVIFGALLATTLWVYEADARGEVETVTTESGDHEPAGGD